MARPAAKPALSKAPTRTHPVAPPTVASPVVEAPEVSAVVAESLAPVTPKVVAEERKVMYSARIRESLRRQVKRHAADTDLTVEEITEAALTEYLTNHSQQA